MDNLRVPIFPFPRGLTLAGAADDGADVDDAAEDGDKDDVAVDDGVDVEDAVDVVVVVG